MRLGAYRFAGVTEQMSSSMRKLLKPALFATGLVRPAYRLHEWLSSLKPTPPPASTDGPPLPPPYLMQIIIGYSDAAVFLETGQQAAAAFAGLFREAGHDLANCQRILDFGCGCGRLARHMPSHTAANLYGVDYNARLIAWCRRNLPGIYARNKLTPPLNLPDNHFDAIYALSVFTHLRQRTQEQWLQELERVLRPGGMALITFHDEHHARATPAVRERLQHEGMVIENDALEGSNLIGAFQSWESARRMFANRFDIVIERPSNLNAFGQAAVVLRKRPA